MHARTLGLSRPVQLGNWDYLVKVMNIYEFRVQGEFDKISDGEGIVICNEPGSNRRCGGQGDLLTGMIATFLHFGMKQKIDSAPVLAAYTASTVKIINWLASNFITKKIRMFSKDVHFLNLISAQTRLKMDKC